MLRLLVTLKLCLRGFRVWLLCVLLPLVPPVTGLLLLQLLQRKEVSSYKALRATGELVMANRCMVPAHRQRILLWAAMRQDQATHRCCCSACRQAGRPDLSRQQPGPRMETRPQPKASPAKQPALLPGASLLAAQRAPSQRALAPPAPAGQNSDCFAESRAQ